MVSSPLFLFLILGESLPLKKMKTLRETLREKNLLNNFLEEQAYHLSQNSFHDQKFLSQPLKNLMDVSIFGGWCSTAPPGGLT